MSKNIEQIVEDLSSLTVVDMSKLKEALETKWGVKASSGMQMMAAAPAAAAVVESTEFQVTLEEVPADKKLGAIKVLREALGLSLKDAKDFAEAAPKVVKESVPKAEAEDLKKKLEAAGTKASIKGL